MKLNWEQVKVDEGWDDVLPWLNAEFPLNTFLQMFLGGNEGVNERLSN